MSNPASPLSRPFRARARLLLSVAALAFPVVRCAADMGGFHDDLSAKAQQQQGDNGPQLSDPISDQFEQLKPIVDAKQWDQAIALLDRMAGSVDPNTYQGGYDKTVIEDTKAKILVEADRLGEAIEPWEETLALCKRHPSYYYSSQISDIVHYLSQIYSQVASSIKLTPGPDLAERQKLQREDFEKATSYMERWMKGNTKVTQDDQLFYADMLFNLAATSSGDVQKKYLAQAGDAAQAGLLMAVHPRDELYYLVAAAAEQQGHLEHAAEVMELLLKHKPDSKAYYPQLMQMYLNLAETSKDPATSKKYYIRAINIIERAQAHGQLTDQKTNFNLVTIYYDMGQFGKATELLSAGLKDGRIDPVAANWQILAYCYQQINENTRAIDTYKDAEKLYPENGEFDFAIGQIYTSMDDLANAFQYYLAAADKGHVTNPYALYINIAYSAYELQKYSEGLKACDEAAKYPEAKNDSQLPQLRDAIAERLKAQSADKNLSAATT